MFVFLTFRTLMDLTEDRKLKLLKEFSSYKVKQPQRFGLKP